jgi:hypothetical protein
LQDNRDQSCPSWFANATMLRAEPISFAETPMELAGANCLVAAASVTPRVVANKPR